MSLVRVLNQQSPARWGMQALFAVLFHVNISNRRLSVAVPSVSILGLCEHILPYDFAQADETGKDSSQLNG